MKRIPADQFMNLNDRPRVAASMAKAIRLLYEKRMYTAVLCLVAAYIDALAGGEKREYLEFLEEHFPDLCREMGGAKEFYTRYRNGMLHEFSPKRGFALAEDHEVGGAYVAEIEVQGVGTLRGLNMDRLARDVLRIADQIAGGATPEGDGRQTSPQGSA